MTSGEDLKKLGIDLVYREEWQRRAREYAFRRIPLDWEGLFEEIRYKITQAPGFFPPHHPNSWPALGHYIRAQGWYLGTGIWRPCVIYSSRRANMGEVIRKIV